MSQATQVFRKFGGAIPLAKALGCTRQAVYRWDYPKERGGCGGYIPGPAIRKVKDAATRLGIELTSEDLAL